jgi:hypothetical protein
MVAVASLLKKSSSKEPPNLPHLRPTAHPQ